jgi:DNA helicase TIP49 (TBP-interacting protein)
MENARRERDTMNEEVITLKTQKQSLIARLRHVLTSQLELMDVLELDDMDISKLKDRTKKVFSAAKKETKEPESPKAEATPAPVEDKEKKPESDSGKKETESNLFKDVFGDDMETLVK